MVYTPTSNDEERRAHALDQAVRIAAAQQIGKYDGVIIVNIAKEFETFLKGGAA